MEHSSDFNEFVDVLRQFRLLRGKLTFGDIDDRNRYVGTFKVKFFSALPAVKIEGVPIPLLGVGVVS